MKAKIFLLIFVAATSLILVSCKKEKNETKFVTLNETLIRGIVYQLDLSQYGDLDDKAIIVTQASDYETSVIAYNATTGNIYKYVNTVNPKSSSTGKDKVVLKVYEPKQSCKKPKSATVITINFTLL